MTSKPLAEQGAETPESVVADLIERARAGMEAFDNANQDAIDDAVTALAWSIYKPDSARRLAELAVEATGLGNVEDKVIKNQRKTFGTLRDLLRVKSTGVIEDLPELGLVKYAKPIG
ncbi:MAG: sulfoacetaldehyde dehydrogenase, partial [Alphaproteobacteria bacterium]|nr:sulfoacetaldehyde dehydrogenase [Alphaproteobacteria bacterium]